METPLLGDMIHLVSLTPGLDPHTRRSYQEAKWIIHR